ncbi:MAG TPA: hypothetical protein ENK45_03545 [Aliiroseovarius sp.]|nr:hypothetical protein [Aliiroseovarius sp.]
MKTPIFKALAFAAMASLATSGTAMAASKYSEVEVTDGGAISGTLMAGDDVQAESKSYTISKDTAVCGEGTREVNFVRVADGHLLDAVVFLVKVKEGKPFDEATATLTLNQEGCEFQPFLSVIRNKGEMTALNSDPVLHNIHVYELIGKARRTLLNVSQPNQGDEVTKEIKVRKGDGLKIECDAHDFMHGFVFVAKNPYYAVVGEDGTFTIDNIPAGTYKIAVWQGQLGTKDMGEVEVSAGGETTIDLTY